MKLWLYLLVSWHLLSAVSAQDQHVPQSSANADETLFLIRILESMYEAWPTDTSDPAAFVEASSSLRGNAIRLREHVRRNNIDSDLDRCFTEFISTLDQYNNFLANIGQIKKDAAEQAVKDSTTTGYNAGFSGGVTYGAMQNQDYTSGQAAVGALAVAGLHLLAESWEKSKVRDEAERRAVEHEARKIQDQITATLGNAQATARRLTRVRGWIDGEAGFELSESQTSLAQSLISKSDSEGLLSLLNSQVKSRPRDPFVRLSRNIVMALQHSTDSSVLLRIAKDCLDAVSLVPESEMYDDYRSQLVYYGGYIAGEARTREIHTRVNASGATEASKFAVACFEWLLMKNRSDPTGELRETLAFQYMGNNQLSESAKMAEEVYPLRQDDAGFCYNYACLMSRRDDPAKALAFLERALQRGFWNINHAKKDPDLEAMRLAKAAEFAALSRVQTEWSVNWGILNDDILLKNNSKFPITNVVLDVRLEQDGRAWTPQLKVDVIGAGETKTWVNAVSIPGGRVTSSKATVSCDQNK
jgi:hypothetical protein